MIKDTFYNLPKEKRERILKAIRHEFETTPFNKISINRIIKEANISRGSYYQYFDDKNDLYVVAMQDSSKHFVKTQINALDKCSGNVFEAFYCIFCDIISRYKERNGRRTVPIFSRSASMGLPSGLKRKWKIVTSEQAKEIKEHIDASNLNISSSSDIDNIVEILMVITKGVVTEYIFGENTEEDAKANFRRKTKLLRDGLEKK